MSQKSEKYARSLLHRQEEVEARMAQSEASMTRWEQIMRDIHLRAIEDARREKTAARRRAREAEYAARVWKTTAYASLATASIVLALAIAATTAKAEESPSAPAPEGPQAATIAAVMELPEAPEPVSKVFTQYYEVPLDTETQDLLRAACEESGIDMTLALAVIWKETGFRNIIGDGGESYGYMQVQPRWHVDRMERLGVTNLMEPAGNFRVGCDFLSELLENHALAYALTYYNSGQAVVSPYAEDVMNYMEVLNETSELSGSDW